MTQTKETSTEARKTGERDEDSYVNKDAVNLMIVIESMRGKNFEPVTIKRVIQRTGLSRDQARRLLISAKRKRWVKELVSPKERQFIPGPGLENLARELVASMLARNAAGQ